MSDVGCQLISTVPPHSALGSVLVILEHTRDPGGGHREGSFGITRIYIEPGGGERVTPSYPHTIRKEEKEKKTSNP